MLNDPVSSAINATAVQPKKSSVNSGWNNVVLYQWDGVVNELEYRIHKEPALGLYVDGEPLEVQQAGQNKQILSRPGSLIFLPSATSLHCSDGGKIRSILAYLNPDYFDNLVGHGLPTKADDGLYYPSVFNDGLIAALLQSLANEMSNPSQVGPLYADSLANALAMRLLHRLTAPIKAECSTAKLSRQKLQMALDVIEASIESGVSIQGLADKVGVSRSCFAKAFKLETGIAPHAYLTKRRINQACLLLSQTQYPIAEIALQCGFSSQAHFTKTFGGAMGLTPSAFRASE